MQLVISSLCFMKYIYDILYPQGGSHSLLHRLDPPVHLRPRRLPHLCLLQLTHDAPDLLHTLLQPLFPAPLPLPSFPHLSLLPSPLSTSPRPPAPPYSKAPCSQGAAGGGRASLPPLVSRSVWRIPRDRRGRSRGRGRRNALTGQYQPIRGLESVRLTNKKSPISGSDVTER